MTQAPGKQIVVGVDGSAASAAAVRWAVREARLRRASVHLVCAYFTDTRLLAPYATRAWTREDEPRAAAQASLDRAADLVRGALPPGRLIAELVDAPPARALLERVAGAEMLVLGASRPAVPPGQPPLPIGPVARVCVRRAPCPVVMVAVGDAGSGDAGSDEHVRPEAGSLAGSGGRHPAPPRRVPVSLE